MDDIKERPGPSFQATDATTERVSDSDKRRQILDGARRVFLAQGFDGASMDGIAKSAGVSKGTLYVYFASKESLFEALIVDMCSCLAEIAIEVPPPNETLEAALIRIGRRYVANVISAEHISSIRMVIGATERFPAFGRLLYAAGPARGLDLLTGYFSAWAGRGGLTLDNPRSAAEDYQNLLVSGLMRQQLMAAADTPSAEEIERHVRRSVASFLKIYGAAS